MAGGVSFLHFAHRHQSHRAVLVSMDTDDDETMTEAQIDELFERTQPIGNAINLLAQAELIVATVDELPPDVAARLDQTFTVVADEIQRGR